LTQSIQKLNTETKTSPEKTSLDGHALDVLGIISESSGLSQREVARKAGISVGLVNLMVKRLVQTGYLKVTNFNSRKAEYFLTPKGFSEITSRSYKYLAKTVRTYQQFCERGKDMIEKLIGKGHREFIVLGNGEIADLILFTLKDMKDSSLQWKHEAPGPGPFKKNGEVILDCRNDCWEDSPGISVLSELLEKTSTKDALS
jgi:predicted transcriptional regulator